MPTLDELRDALAGRYAIEGELGAGGMATVYLARDERHDRQVALKVLHTEQGLVLGAERFEREIRVLARLRHPFVLPLHDSGEAAGSLYFVMPVVDGESLRARLAREGALSLAETVRLLRHVAEALDYAHSEGVVHRDVKPENILLSRHGHAMLADFGIARGDSAGAATQALTQMGMALGTTTYMSPEQALGETVDGRSDVYSLGCVAYEMLVGRPPFSGANALSIVAQHLSAPVPALTLSRDVTPPYVVTAGARVLAKDPAARFATAADFVAALNGDDGSVIASAGTASIPVAATRLSLAVMPVANRSADVENEYFSDGMTDELINALAKVEGLRVVSRSSVFSFKGKDLPLREIGATLDVAFLLESSVRRAGDRLRVTAQLVRVSDDTTLWSETYERVLADVFAVQDDITRRIVSTITQTMQLGHLRGIVTPRPPRSLAVYDLYLLGRFHWNKRTEEGMRHALELFERAVEADPTYAPAYSGIADASALLASWQFASPAEMYPRASAAARRAIELDPASAEAHASLGFVKINWEWDWDGAIASLRRAIALNPSNETAHRWLSAFLVAIGQRDEGFRIARRVPGLDPVSVLPHMNLGICHYLSGQHREAAAEFRIVIARDPAFVRGYVFLAAALSQLGEHASALEAAERAEVMFGNHPMGRTNKGYVLATAGETAAARAIFAETVSAAAPLYRAFGFALLGEDEAAIDALEHGYEERGDWMYSIGSQPPFRHLHAHPRFVALMQKMHLSNI